MQVTVTNQQEFELCCPQEALYVSPPCPHVEKQMQLYYSIHGKECNQFRLYDTVTFCPVCIDG